MTALTQFTAITTCSRSYAACAGVPAELAGGAAGAQGTHLANPLARSRKSRALRVPS
jgi:hypothetical protein